MITFNEDHLAEEFAYIVENDLLLHAVDQQLSNHPSITVIYNAKVEDIILPEKQGEDATITLHSGEKFKTKLLVSIFQRDFVKNSSSMDTIFENKSKLYEDFPNSHWNI